MKKNNIIILLFLILTSCEDYLDRPPLDQITDQQMTFSAKEIELYSNKYYGSFPTFSGIDYGPYEKDNASDNFVSGAYNYNPQMSGTIVVPSSGGGWDWSAIRGINFLLVNYHKSIEPLSQTGSYIGEMYFWRAWHYFELLKQFGDLPWIEEPLYPDSEELYGERVPRNIIADNIITDLTKAAELMSEKDVAKPGRLHKDVALIFKSRVALYEGSWEKYHDGTIFGVENANPNKYFQIAAEAAYDIIKKDVYKIEPVGNDPNMGYWSLFNQRDLSNNKEVLLWRKYDKALDNYHRAQNIWGKSDGNTGISKYLVESYLCIDGKPISESELYQGDDLIENEVKNRDPRLRQTIYTEGVPRIIVDGKVTGAFSVPDLTLESRLRNTTGYQMYKGCDPAAEHEAGDINACIIFRYAEALLNYAEAKEELGECNQEVLDISINKLRDRVDMPHLTVEVGFVDPKWDFESSVSPLMNEIRRERRVELACEGYRFDDLMRWAATHLIKRPMIGAKMKQFTEIKDKFNPILEPENIYVNEKGYIAPHWNSPAKNGWQFNENTHYLKPLPSNELVINTNLEQNPGY